MDYFELLEKYGHYIKNGMTYALTQQPYLSVCGRYRANAIDIHDNDHCLEWDIINDDCEDESEACDWTRFRVKAG